MDTTHARTNTPRDAHRRGYEIPVCVCAYDTTRNQNTRPRSIDRLDRHSSTLCDNEQCPRSSLPPSSAASPPSRRPRSKYVFRRSSRRERRANGAKRAPSSREGTNARKCASVAGDRRTKSIGASRRARERERGDRRGRWVRGKRYARAFTARVKIDRSIDRVRVNASQRGDGDEAECSLLHARYNLSTAGMSSSRPSAWMTRRVPSGNKMCFSLGSSPAA